MEFTNLPVNFAPAFADLIYTLEGIPGETMPEIEIVSPSCGVLGVKRCPEGGAVDINIAGYLQGCFDPTPLQGGECGFSCDPGRIAAAYLWAGALVSPQRVFTAGVASVGDFGLMSHMPAERMLFADEYDELSIAAPDTVLSARIIVSGAEKEIYFDIPSFPVSAGVATLRVDAAHIAARASGQGMRQEECRNATVKIYSHSELIHSVAYTLSGSSRGGVRVCWLNSLGGIDYHTFRGESTEEIRADKERIRSAAGYRVVASHRERHYTLTAGYYPRSVAAALGDIISSSRVWRVEDNRLTPLDVLSDSVTVSSDTLSPFRIVVREKEVVKFQNL